MKAISPALPMAAPPRQPSAADASAADEAFSALIAAVIGAPAAPSAPSAPSVSSRSSARVETQDDARPAAATSTSTSPSTQAVRESAAATTGEGDSAKSPVSAKSPDAVPPRTPQATAEQVAKPLRPGVAPVTSTPPPPATSPTDQPKVPAGLEKAAAVLAQALTATTADSTTPVPAKRLPADGSTPAPATVNPGTALTDGQLPAQLIVAVTTPQTQSSPPTTASVPAVRPVERPDGKAVAAGDTKQMQIAPLVATQPDGVPAVSTPVSTLASQAARPEASSDAIASPAVGAIVASTTTNHAKPSDGAPAGVKPAAHDQGAQGTTAQHFEAQLSAQGTAQPTQLTPASPAQQSQPTFAAGMLPQQIVQVVAPLRSAKDGDYTLSLQLHPADLGAVTVRVEVQQGVLSVHLSAEHAHGHEALSQSLADLRTQLQSSGVRTGDIVVAARPSPAPQQQEQQHAGGRHQQEARTYDDSGAERRPDDRPSRQAQQQADDDTLDVRI